MWADSDLNLIDLCTELNLKDKSFRDYLFFLASEDGYSNNFFLKEEISINNTRFDEFKVFFTDEKFSNDRLATLELSLFPSWYKLLDDLEKDVTSKTLKRTGSFLKYFIGYFSTLSFGVVIIFFFIFTSSMEAERILKKLTISIPSFENIDSLNTFDEPVTSNFVAEEDFKFDEKIEVLDDSERFDTESEIEFVDYEKIKTHFSALGREKTEFEEETKGVFREARYGYSTVYRIMIETSDSYSFLNDFKKLKKRFTFEKAGKVEPGLFIPGGNYFNLLVSSDKFGDVLKELQKYRPMIYASRSKGRKIPGKTKVFIFLSKI